MPGPSIFVVEDDAIIALRNYELLTKSGYQVPRMFSTGEDLLGYLSQSGPPDLILMDVGLGGKIDGIETARRVLQKYTVPVIFLSSYTDEQRRVRATKISSYGYLVKPIHEQDLLETIEAVLGKGKRF